MNKTLAAPELTGGDVVALVQKRLAAYQSAEAVLEVLPKAVHREGRWWYVVVPPGESIVNLSDYNARIEKAERDLRRQDNLSVGILPVIPDWMDTLK